MFFSVARRNVNTYQANSMTTEQIAKLNKVFNRLESDIPLYLVIALSDGFKVSQEEIVRQYEAWQIA